MATQEERLTALENDFRKFKMETVKAYQDVAVDVLMIKGIALGAMDRLTAIRGQIEDFRLAVVQRLDRQDSHFEAQEAHFNMHQKQIDALEKNMNARFDTHDQRFNVIEQRFESMDRRFDRLEKLLLDRLPPA